MTYETVTGTSSSSLIFVAAHMPGIVDFASLTMCSRINGAMSVSTISRRGPTGGPAATNGRPDNFLMNSASTNGLFERLLYGDRAQSRTWSLFTSLNLEGWVRRSPKISVFRGTVPNAMKNDLPRMLSAGVQGTCSGRVGQEIMC